MITGQGAATKASPAPVAPVPPRPRKAFAPVLKTAMAAVAVIAVGAGVYYGVEQRRTDAPTDVAAATRRNPLFPRPTSRLARRI